MDGQIKWGKTHHTTALTGHKAGRVQRRSCYCCEMRANDGLFKDSADGKEQSGLIRQNAAASPGDSRPLQSINRHPETVPESFYGEGKLRFVA